MLTHTDCSILVQLLKDASYDPLNWFYNLLVSYGLQFKIFIHAFNSSLDNMSSWEALPASLNYGYMSPLNVPVYLILLHYFVM